MKDNAVNRGDLLREQVGYRHEEEHQHGSAEADGNFILAEAEVQRCLVFLIVALETQRENAQSLQKEAPDDAEGICFTEQVHVAAAADDGENLGDRDQVDDSDRSYRSVAAACETTRAEHRLRRRG